MWVEGYIGPRGTRTRFLNLDDPYPWLQGFQPKGERALPTTRLGVNVWWNDNALEVTAGNFTIHGGLAYLSVPDDLTRMRLMKHLLGVVP